MGAAGTYGLLLPAPLKDLLLFLRPAICIRIYIFAIDTKKDDTFDSGDVCVDDATWTRRRRAPPVMARLVCWGRERTAEDRWMRQETTTRTPPPRNPVRHPCSFSTRKLLLLVQSHRETTWERGTRRTRQLIRWIERQRHVIYKTRRLRLYEKKRKGRKK